MTVDLLVEVTSIFNSINIFGIGIILLWIVGSVFIGKYITTNQEEWMVSIMLLWGSGLMLIFVNDPAKYVLLIIMIIFVLIALFRKVFNRQQ